MDYWLAAVAAALIIGYAVVSRRLRGTPITAAIVFVTAGLILGPAGVNVAHLEGAPLTAITTLCLIVVLFADAARIDRRPLRAELGIPTRLLAIGMPLTVAVGTFAAMLILGLDIWSAALLSAILAPTDAALGQAVVGDKRIPSRIRQGLNIESGLNDGLAVPFAVVFLALAEAEQAGHTEHFLDVAIHEIGFGVLGGAIAGVVAAVAVGFASRRGWGEGSWLQLAAFSAPLAAFGLSKPLGGSEFIAAFTCGICFSVVARRHGDQLLAFTDEAAELLAALTFTIFGAVMLGPVLSSLDLTIVLYAGVSLTLVRMLPVAIAMIGSRARPATLLFLGWFGPRGLASIVMGLVYLAPGTLDRAGEMLAVVAFTVGLSVYVHGLSAAPGAGSYARWYAAHPQNAPPLMESQPADEQRVRGPQTRESPVVAAAGTPPS